jgi:TRAP-type mannitol/chloroaromatic compound transport system permease large subunit
MLVLALIVTLLLVMATGIPVAIGLAAIGLGTGRILDGPDAVFALPQTFYSANNSFLITAIPLFILMSEILRRAGVTEVLFEFVRAPLAQDARLQPVSGAHELALLWLILSGIGFPARRCDAHYCSRNIGRAWLFAPIEQLMNCLDPA